MINKEEIEKDIVEYTTQFFPSRDEIDRKLRNSRLKLIAKGILEIIEENERLEEINKEHQKLNGELQEKLTKVENENKRLQGIIDGKVIQELGTSDLYEEDN